MTNVGGQAVLEGVMMRGPSNWAVAVRKPTATSPGQPDDQLADGTPSDLRVPGDPRLRRARRVARHRFRALAISANYPGAAEAKEGEESEEVATELTRGQLVFAFAIAIGFAVLLFKVGRRS
jgi:uncharacterized protein YqhQ